LGNMMFPFITKTWSPAAGECPYDCYQNPITGKPGCWAKILVDRYHYKKYQGPPRLDAEAMKKIPEGGFIFVESMGELSTLQAKDTKTLMKELALRTDTKYLTLVKNPWWYARMNEAGVTFPPNVTLGATIETNRLVERSKAPPPMDRLLAMAWCKEKLENDVFISIEPIMEFDREYFLPSLSFIHPWVVAIGYDNYHNGLPEPSLAKTTELIKALETRGITVYRKTLREANLGAEKVRVNG
jgi:hypothetical protein